MIATDTYNAIFFLFFVASLDFIPSATTLVLPPSATPTITCTNQTAAIIDDGLSLEGVEWFRVAFEFLSDTVLSDGEFILVPVLQEARVAITDNDGAWREVSYVPFVL